MRTLIAFLALASLLPAQNPVYANGNRVKLSRLNNRHALPSRGLEALWVTGVRNLLKYPEDLTNAAWDAAGGATSTSVTENATTAPDGTVTADRAYNTTGGHTLRQPLTVVPGSSYVFTFYAKNNGGTVAHYSVYDISNSAEVIAATSYFSLLTEDWVRVSVPFTTPVGCSSVGVYLLRENAAGSDLYLWHPQLNAGSTALPYDGNTADPSLATFYDLSGNGNTLTLGTGSNAPTVGSTGLVFGGVDDTATSAISAQASTTSIAVFNTGDLNGTWPTIYSMGTADQVVIRGSDNRPYVQFNYGAGGSIVSSAPYTLGEWAALAHTVSGSTVNVFLDGGLQQTGEITARGAGSLTLVPNPYTYLGTIFSVAIYSRAASAADVFRADRYLKTVAAQNGRSITW